MNGFSNILTGAIGLFFMAVIVFLFFYAAILILPFIILFLLISAGINLFNAKDSSIVVERVESKKTADNKGVIDVEFEIVDDK